ncbi:hypothetical protein LAZ67_3000269 [Cordylochernes scorpioides]|uniref:CREB-binding protein/p300 atypical RING domain-containing protein n=1 Tax=Cordylochernes scorpioides TaxID=51811 RepID=A0ABY6K657_9ARAC|nr:hypothetical protein LAZ67_3000269 [Cordylochernes scorpioides]
MILANRQITVRVVAEDLNISIGSCHSIFINDLGMRRIVAKFVPKLLNCDQKQHRMNIANEMLDSVRDDPNLLQRVITGDEAWVYGYDVETKAQWKLPHEPRPKKAHKFVFFDCRGVVHHEFLPQGRTVNKEYYLQVMRNLHEAIRQKRPDLWKNKNWLLDHDNTPAHTSLLVRDFLAKNNTLMMPQPPYFPDLAPCDFFLFPKLKRPMKGRRYATLDEIKTASKEELKSRYFLNTPRTCEKQFDFALTNVPEPRLLSEVFEQEIDPVMQSLGYCCGRKYVFQPQVLCCYGKQLCTIPRDTKYYSYMNRNRQHQTTLTRFRTGHLKPLKMENNNKIYPTCPKCSLAPTAPEHILACIRCTKQDLWERPLLIIKQLEEHELMEFV